MLDPYGNYALQEVMDKWPEQHFLPLISKDQDGLTCSVNKIAQLSIQKFSSNVVEKCIKMGNSEERNLIILNIAKISKLVSLMHSSFGNYVVQTALELSEGESLEALSESIYKNIPEISDKKIRTKWAKLLSDRLQTSQELASTYDLNEYLVEGIQALQPPKDREDPTMPSYPGYGHAQGKFQGHQASPFKKPSPQPSPASQPKSEESPGMNKGPSSYKTNRVEGKNHFQVFGAFTLKPQFNDSDDSD